MSERITIRTTLLELRLLEKLVVFKNPNSVYPYNRTQDIEIYVDDDEKLRQLGPAIGKVCTIAVEVAS